MTGSLDGKLTGKVALVARIDREQGRLDILINDVWDADHLIEWHKPVWEQRLADGFRPSGSPSTHTSSPATSRRRC